MGVGRRGWYPNMNTFHSYNRPAVITKSDTIDSTDPNLGNPLALYVGGAGVVACVLEDATVVNMTAVAGGILPVRVKRVNSTNTTATLIVGLYRA